MHLQGKDRRAPVTACSTWRDATGPCKAPIDRIAHWTDYTAQPRAQHCPRVHMRSTSCLRSRANASVLQSHEKSEGGAYGRPGRPACAHPATNRVCRRPPPAAAVICGSGRGGGEVQLPSPRQPRVYFLAASISSLSWYSVPYGKNSSACSAARTCVCSATCWNSVSSSLESLRTKDAGEPP